MLISRSVNELANEIVWTIEFVPANLGANHYAFKSLNAAAGESEVFSYDVEVVVDPDIPVIYDVLINPVQALYTLYEEVIKTPLTYEVYFNTNGGNEMGAQNAEYNTLLTEPGQPTKEGYSFKGWFKDPGFVYSWNFESDRIMGVTTLYAKWEINTYLVHFDPQGGSNTFSPITVEYGSNIEEPAPTPTRSNYTFLGWFKDIGCNTPWNFTEDTIAGDTTLYGKWDATALTVMFDSQGGNAIGSISADYDTMITKPNDPQKSGFTFKGWYQDAACNSVWTFASDRVKFDLTLFAKWDVNLYTVSFDSLGGSAVPAQTAQNESVTAKPADPLRSGYSFGGWFKEDACITPWDFAVDKVTQDTTLFALWTADAAALEFITNNGTDVPKMVGATDREILDTNMPITVRDGYTFSGWFASADFSGDVVTALPGKYPIGTMIYYAKWTANPAFIEFVTNSGSTVSNMTGVTDLTIAPTTMPTTNRAGYTFSGWFAEADFSEAEVTALPGQYPIGTTIYYAKWTANPAAIEFIVNGGSTVTNMTGVTDQAIADTTMQTTTRAGYTFSGWYQESDFSGAEVTALPGQYPIGTTTYYAKWTADPAAIEFNVNGGSEVITMTGVTDQAIAPTTMPTTNRAGYTFSGWYQQADFSGTEITALPGQYPIGTTTYYAKWTANPAAIEFIVNGGSTVANMTGVTDQTISPNTMPTTSKTGYTFENWYENADFSGDPVSVLPSAFPVGTKTYYAKWTPIKYAVSFDSQSGSAVDTQMVDYDTLAILPATPTRSGYTFTGWFKESGCVTSWNFTSDKITEDITLYAGWNLGIPDASVPLNNWSWDQVNQVVDLGLGESYFDIGEEKNITLSTGEILTLQVYGFNHDQLADGTENKANITFGLKNLMAAQKRMAPSNTNYYGWEGSEIRGWTNGITTTFASTAYLTGTTSLRSQLPSELKPIIKSVKKYTSGGFNNLTLVASTDKLFLFSENEVNGTYGPSMAGEGDQYQIFINSPSQVKYLSNGSGGSAWWWLRSPLIFDDYGYRIITNEGVIGNYLAASDLGVNFGFAVGNAPTNTYTVAYNSNGGSAVSNGTGTLNQTITAPTAPTKANMTFGGWYEDAGLTQKWDFTTDKIVGSTTLYAKWQTTITFDSQGGTAVAPLITDAYKTFEAPASPSKDGWVFKGWYKEATCLTAWNFAVDQPLINTILYAKWEAGLPDSSVPLENWSWDQINQVVDLGKAQDYFVIGEEKNIVVNGETLTLQIYDFNHDVLSDGTGNKTNITFGLKYLMATNRIMGNSNFGGWNGSDMRTWTNGNLFGQLPVDIQNVVKTVNKQTSGGYNATSIIISADKLFLFSEVELFGTNSYSIAGEGVKYPIFTSNGSRIKKISNETGSTTSYWQRSPSTSIGGTDYLTVNSYGDLSMGHSLYNPCHFDFGFCIGNAPTNTYTVSYNSNGGSSVASTTATLNTTIAEPTVPTKANMIFDGWYKDSGLTSKFDFANDKITGTTTLYAKWKTLPTAGQPLSAYTWDEIRTIADEGLGDVYWDVGQTKDMTLSTGEVVTMQIYDFDHDDKSDGTGKTNVTFGTKDLMGTLNYPNPTLTNVGGWNSSAIRTWANNTLYNQLPTEIKNSITSVYKKTSSGNGSATIIDSVDKVFLFSEIEVFGELQNSYSGEGTHYQIFTNNTSRIKKLSNGTGAAKWWWLRSPSRDGNTGFADVFATGEHDTFNANMVGGAAFGFAMGNAKAIPDQGTTLKDCSWQQVANVANAGKSDDYWNIGDTKDMTLSTGEVVTMQVYDFNHDDKSDGSGKANITFGTKNLMASTQTMNSTNTSSGGWNSSNIRAWTNGTLFSQLPYSLQSDIKTVNKNTAGGGLGTITTKISTDKVFFFSEIELFGISYYTIPGEGTKYPIFTDDTSRIKKLNNGSGVASNYWGRSCYTGTNSSFSCVTTSGAHDYYTISNIGVAFGFCLGNAPTYTVAFDAQGGNLVTPKTAEINSSIIPPSTPTKLGQTFAGWFKDAAGTTEWNFTTDKVTGQTTLYAKWITLPSLGTSLEACSWDQIAYISKAGLADAYFDVGNEKNITLSTGEVLTMQIYDFAHDNKSDGSGKAGITFGTKNLMTSNKAINTTDTNIGGWNGTNIRSWTNGTLYNSMATDLKNVIKPVEKLTSGGYLAQNIVTTSDKVFLFSQKEVSGINTFTLAGEGTQYPIFTNAASIVKYYPNATVGSWSLRSPYSNQEQYFMGVGTNGSTNYTYYASSPWGICFGFSV